MSVWDVVVLVLVGALVVSRFLIFKLPKDSRDKATRKKAYKADLQQVFGKLGSRDLQTQKEVEKDLQPEKKPAEAPVVKKLRLKELESMSGLDQVKAMDSAFDETRFLDGARRAHAYFYQCWNARDLDGLAGLCAPVLTNRIAAQWEDDWHKMNVGDVSEARIVSARVSGRTAIVEAELVASHKEKRGVARTVTSRWLLARAIGSTEPDWELEDMRVEADA